MELEEFIKRIEDVEKNVDKVLKAARLERHERRPLSTDELEMVLNRILIALAMVLGAALIFSLFYFTGR